jgi:hypothetical protein
MLCRIPCQVGPPEIRGIGCRKKDVGGELVVLSVGMADLREGGRGGKEGSNCPTSVRVKVRSVCRRCSTCAADWNRNILICAYAMLIFDMPCCNRQSFDIHCSAERRVQRAHVAHGKQRRFSQRQQTNPSSRLTRLARGRVRENFR